MGKRGGRKKERAIFCETIKQPENFKSGCAGSIPRGRGVIPRKVGWGCAAHFSKPLPYLPLPSLSPYLIYDQNLRYSLPYL